MTTGNIYKPRYKIPFLAKSKIWPYKNSRLRRFFNIRGRKLIRGGMFKRYFMVFNNMKWAIARRYIRPYMQRRRATRRRFKNVFYAKQQLRKFYGKQKEKAFLKMFTLYSQNVARRNLSFAAALERRADVVLFRLRFLPTIYACHQYIHHQGILINDVKQTSPYTNVNPGDCITFEEPTWSIFFNYVWERLHWRTYGLYLWKARQYKILKKKIWYLKKDNRAKAQNVMLLKKYYKLLHLSNEKINSFENFGATLLQQILVLKAKFNRQERPQLDTIYSNYQNLMRDFRAILWRISIKFNALYSKRARVKQWRWQQYNNYFFKMLELVIFQYKFLKKMELQFKLLEYSFYKWFYIYNFDIKNQELKTELDSVTLQYSEISSIKNSEATDLKIKSNTLKNLINQTKIQARAVFSLIDKKESLLMSEYNSWIEKLVMYQQLLIRRRIKIFSMKPRFFYNKKLNKMILRKSKLKLHLILQRKKNLRSMAIPRLKPIHWYIPDYIHFDYTTLSAVFLYNPLPEEIVYSFKCSLQNIYSFYRALGH